VPSLVCDAHGLVQHANAPLADAFGWSADALRGRSLAELVAPSHRPWLRELLVPGPPGGSDHEVELVTADDAPVPVQLTVVRVASEGDEALLVTIRDLSERHALTRSEAAFRALVEATTEAVVFHRDGRVVLANDACAAMFGTYATGEPLLRFVAPEWHDEVIRRTFANDTSIYEAVAVHDDGTRFPVEARGARVMYQGELTRVAILRDLRERRALEERLAVADRLASMGILASSVAHEINNPLAYVTLELERVQRVLGGATIDDMAQVEASVGHALEGAERIRAIVDDLRELVRPPDDDDRAADVRVAVERAASMGRSSLQRSASVQLDVPEGLWVSMPEGRLSQVLLNLMVNAAQAIGTEAPERHRVTVRAAAAGPSVSIEVSDTGPGVPEELRERLFEPFVTAGATSANTGLGLFIVRELVQRVGGTVQLVDEAEGATFRVLLPAVDAPAERVPPREQPQEAPRARVLVIDDDPGVLDVIGQLLEESTDVVMMSSGEAALELLSHDARFDVVLCDWMMPHLSGQRLLDRLQQQWPQLVDRLVVMSGGARPAEVNDEGRPTAFLAKPFRARVLFATIRDVVEQCGLFEGEPG
jgi:PAS domain S-box-containing protein